MNKSSGIIKETFDGVTFLFERYASNNYELMQTMQHVNKEKFYKLMQEKGAIIHKFDINLKTKIEYIEVDTNKTNDSLIVVNVVDGNDKIILDLYSKNIASLSTIYTEIFDNCIKGELLSESVNINFYKFSLNARGGLSISQEKIKQSDFQSIIPDFYPSIDIDLFIKEFYARQENILILSGESGTGKTKFASLVLKQVAENYHLLEHKKEELDFDDESYEDSDEIKVVYVKNEDILHTEDFWIALSSQHYDFVLLDDLDYMLLPREKEVTSQIDINKAKFISQLLSYTDGVVPTKTKFIITSNKVDSDIDPALMRCGRLFDILNFHSLTNKEAFDIWVKSELDEELFPFKQEAVLAAELGSAIKMVQKDKNIKLKGYLKDTSVSSTVKAIEKSKSKIGLRG